MMQVMSETVEVAIFASDCIITGEGIVVEINMNTEHPGGIFGYDKMMPITEYTIRVVGDLKVQAC